MDRVCVDVFDYSYKKLASLYDSNAVSKGSIYDIQLTHELNGSRSLLFVIPYMIDNEYNWRWKYIQAQYKVRVTMGEQFEDWFIITNPKKQKSNKTINQTIYCDHLSSILKTKNLYLNFDDTNGIGDAPYLMHQIMAGTGWSFDEEGSDVFYENYAGGSEPQIKKRSLQSDGKAGAYSLVTQVCDLFNAYPVYDAVKRTVQLHDINNKKPLRQMIVGVNLNAVTVEYNSSNIITRLYVEGDYDQDSYVGIDDVNPTGLSYLMNFDYYRSIGVFTDEHQAALDKYYVDIKNIKQQTYDHTTQLTNKLFQLNNLWGTQNYVLWTITNGQFDRQIVGGNDEPDEAKIPIDVGDKMYIFWNEYGETKYTVVDVDINTSFVFDAQHYPVIGSGTVTHVLKWIQKCSGSIGAKQVQIQAKQEIIEQCEKDNEKQTTSQKQKQQNLQTIAQCKAAIELIKNGDPTLEPQVFDYLVKVTGQHQLPDDEQKQLYIKRSSVNSILNTTTYKLAQHVADFSSDNTVKVLTNNTRITFGQYGNTESLPANTEYHALEGKLYNLSNQILDVTTAQRKFDMTVAGDMIVNGTTFTISVKALPYSLYEQYDIAIHLAVEVDDLKNAYEQDVAEQKQIESDFAISMGDMLKDGYWSDDNYIAGQEQYLYNDALDVINEVSKPAVTYSVSLNSFAQAICQETNSMQLNTKVRIYDPELNINDTVYVSKISRYLDQPDKSTVQISNEQVSISSSFDSIFSRVSDISRLIEQKKTIFERAKGLTSKGTLAADRLQGAISAMTTKLGASVSSWYTDDDGNIMFETADGSSAMKLCGDGWMIANSKTDSGDWRWRTAASGDGIVADTITTGYLSADRIESESITANKLAADVGKQLDLSSNLSINLTVRDAIDGAVGYYMKIAADNGPFITDTTKSITIDAVLADNGIDVTDDNYQDFKWFMNGELYTTGVKQIAFDESTLKDNAVIECMIVKEVPNGKKDSEGKDIMVERTYYDSMNIANIVNRYDVQIFLNSSLPTHQVYDPNSGGSFQPDWHIDLLHIKPVVYVSGNRADLESIDFEWSKYCDGKQFDIDDEIIDVSTGVMTVERNMMYVHNCNTLKYVFSVFINGTWHKKEIEYEFIRCVELPRTCVISGTNVFRYNNGVVNPNAITLTADVANVQIVAWKYKQADGSWSRIPGTGVDNVISIMPSDSIFIDNECVVKLETTDPDVYDMFTICKVSSDPGSDARNYYSYIRYSAYSDGTNMQLTPTASTKYVGIYAGPSANIPDKESFIWAKYAGKADDINVQETYIDYNQSSAVGKPADEDPGWIGIMPERVTETYLWTRATVVFTNGVTLKTYNVTYNGNASSDGVKYFVFIRYSAQADGTNMKQYPNTDTNYIGIYCGTSSTAPTNKTAYSWARLKGDDGIAGGDIQVVQVTTKYAITSTNEQPETTSSAWTDDMPTAQQGRYMWVWSRAKYSDDTYSNRFNVAYSGTDGDNTTMIYATDECYQIAAKYDGRCELFSTVTHICAYNGNERIVPFIDPNSISYGTLGMPDGLAVTVQPAETNDELSTYRMVPVRITVSENADLGSSGQTNGQIIIPVSVMNNGIVHRKTIVIRWNKLNKSEYGSSKNNIVTFRVYTDDTVFEQETITAKASAYDASNDIRNIGMFKWYALVNGAWQEYVFHTDKVITIMIPALSAKPDGLYKCVMSYNGNEYVQIFALYNKEGPFQSVIVSSNGYSIPTTVQNTQLICNVINDGRIVDDEIITYNWHRVSETGQSMRVGSSRTLTVRTRDIKSGATYICDSSYGTTSIIDLSTYSKGTTVSSVPPTNPEDNDIWIDTSSGEDIMKRYIAEYYSDGELIPGRWVDVTNPTSEIVDIVTEQVASNYVTKTQIGSYVSEEKYNKDMQFVEKQIASTKLTNNQFSIMFESSGVGDRVNNAIGKSIDDYSNEMKKYLRYTDDGVLSLGSVGDENETFEAQLSQKKLAFIYKGDGENKEVAYIGANDMYITNARVTQALYIGYSDVGYFNWTVTQTGLGLKWVGKNA